MPIDGHRGQASGGTHCAQTEAAQSFALEFAQGALNDRPRCIHAYSVNTPGDRTQGAQMMTMDTTDFAAPGAGGVPALENLL
jgi:hypothetical protein